MTSLTVFTSWTKSDRAFQITLMNFLKSLRCGFDRFVELNFTIKSL